MNPAGSSSNQKPIVFFDGVCGLCNRFIDFLIRHDKNHNLLFATLQGKTAEEKIKPGEQFSMNTMILLKNGILYYRSSAAIRLFIELGGGWKLMGGFFIFPAFIRDPVYDWIARNRYKWWGRREICRVPGEKEKLFFIE